jgi:uncharacterized protein
MTPPLCIYHHGCADGFAGAFVVRRYMREHAIFNAHATDSPTLKLEPVEFHPGIYGEAPPDVTDRDVILVDFSYKRPDLLRMAAQARSILIIDHHKSAAEELLDLPANTRTVFNMGKSGAMLAWEQFFPGQMPPLLLDHIQDRDLWQFRLPMTREIVAALYSYPMDFDTWDKLMKQSMLNLEHEGRALLRQQESHVDALIENLTRWVHFGDTPIPAANVPWFYASEVAGRLADGNPFAAAYHDDEDGRKWSLRSNAEGADVSAIAQALGGGGHRNAAGFRMTREEVVAFEAKGGRL